MKMEENNKCEGYMRMNKACKYLDVGKSTAYEFIKRGYLKPIRLSAGVVVFKKSDLDEFIASRMEIK